MLREVHRGGVSFRPPQPGLHTLCDLRQIGSDHITGIEEVQGLGLKRISLELK